MQSVGRILLVNEDHSHGLVQNSVHLRCEVYFALLIEKYFEILDTFELQCLLLNQERLRISNECLDTIDNNSVVGS